MDYVVDFADDVSDFTDSSLGLDTSIDRGCSFKWVERCEWTQYGQNCNRELVWSCDW